VKEMMILQAILKTSKGFNEEILGLGEKPTPVLTKSRNSARPEVWGRNNEG
jgi:hypothetical protein